MIGRTHMTHFVDDGSVGACEHLIEVAKKRLREALAARDEARRTIAKARDEIRRRKEQLRRLHRAARVA